MKLLVKRSKLIWLVSMLVLAMMAFIGCGQSSDVADTVLKSTNIYTVASEEPVSGGVAIKDGIILAVGSEEEIAGYIGDDTDVTDYGDQMIMPGFIDAHTHSEAARTVIGVDVIGVTSMEEAAERTKAFMAENPDKDFIIGGGWYAAEWGGAEPDKSYLDAVSTEIPIILYDFDDHCLWCNSKALEVAKIDAAFAKQYNAEHNNQEFIVVDDAGEPTGYLKEDAYEYVRQFVPACTTEELEYCINIWNEYGVTTINEMTQRHYDDIYYDQIEELYQNDRLNVRHMLTVESEATDDEIDALIDRFNAEQNDVLKFTSLKEYMDGVGASYTAAMKDKYVDRDTYGGDPYLTAEEVAEMVEKAARHGLVTHLHTCGDMAVQVALDGYEIAAANGVELDPRFSIEHCDTVAPEDINRPAELNVSCNVTPDFMAPTEDWDTNPYLQVYTEDVCKELWNIGSLYNAGGNVAFGTDSYFSSYSPFVQMYRATERVMNDGKPEGGYLPEEKLSLQDAIRCYTINAAVSCGMEDKIGTLEAGKYADIIVLDTNILTCTPQELFDAGVDVTYMNGKEVYRKAK